MSMNVGLNNKWKENHYRMKQLQNFTYIYYLLILSASNRWLCAKKSQNITVYSLKRPFYGDPVKNKTFNTNIKHIINSKLLLV